MIGGQNRVSGTDQTAAAPPKTAKGAEKLGGRGGRNQEVAGGRRQEGRGQEKGGGYETILDPCRPSGGERTRSNLDFCKISKNYIYETIIIADIQTKR